LIVGPVSEIAASVVRTEFKSKNKTLGTSVGGRAGGDTGCAAGEGPGVRGALLMLRRSWMPEYPTPDFALRLASSKVSDNPTCIAFRPTGHWHA
jgi:hypothetical protein